MSYIIKRQCAGSRWESSIYVGGSWSRNFCWSWHLFWEQARYLVSMPLAVLGCSTCWLTGHLSCLILHSVEAFDPSSVTTAIWVGLAWTLLDFQASTLGSLSLLREVRCLLLRKRVQLVRDSTILVEFWSLGYLPSQTSVEFGRAEALVT